MANQTFNPTTAKYLARVDGAPDPQPSARVTPVCPYDDNNQSCPYDGNWKGSLIIYFYRTVLVLFLFVKN